MHPRYHCLCFQILHAISPQFSSLTTVVANPENGLILRDHSRTGLLSGLKSYYPSTKDECEEGVEFATKVNDILDAL